jgi:small conductance mechanosensitive channel
VNFIKWLPDIPEAWIESALSVLAISAGTLFLWALVKRAARRARERFEHVQAQHAEIDHNSISTAAQRLTALQLVVNSARYVLFGAAILLIFTRLNLIKSDSLLFPAGFLGAALGLGAQNLVRDVVAGVFIVFENQFSVDDWVKINGVVGRVEEVGLRVTRVRDEAAQIHFFPNGAITTVARFPRAAQTLILWVPMAKEKRDDKNIASVREALESFDLVHDAWSGPAQRLEDEGIYLRFALPVTPAQGAVVREKLPPRIVALLEGTGGKIETGATVEITAAPVE